MKVLGDVRIFLEVLKCSIIFQKVLEDSRRSQKRIFQKKYSLHFENVNRFSAIMHHQKLRLFACWIRHAVLYYCYCYLKFRCFFELVRQLRKHLYSNSLEIVKWMTPMKKHYSGKSHQRCYLLSFRYQTRGVDSWHLVSVLLSFYSMTYNCLELNRFAMNLTDDSLWLISKK